MKLIDNGYLKKDPSEAFMAATITEIISKMVIAEKRRRIIKKNTEDVDNDKTAKISADSMISERETKSFNRKIKVGTHKRRRMNLYNNRLN